MLLEETKTEKKDPPTQAKPTAKQSHHQRVLSYDISTGSHQIQQTNHPGSISTIIPSQQQPIHLLQAQQPQQSVSQQQLQQQTRKTDVRAQPQKRGAGTTVTLNTVSNSQNIPPNQSKVQPQQTQMRTGHGSHHTRNASMQNVNTNPNSNSPNSRILGPRDMNIPLTLEVKRVSIHGWLKIL